VVKLGLDLLHLLADALRRVHDELLGGYCRQGAVPARRSGITLRRRLANLVGEQDRAGAHMDLGWLGGWRGLTAATLAKQATATTAVASRMRRSATSHHISLTIRSKVGSHRVPPFRCRLGSGCATAGAGRKGSNHS
jgi:hypothetical protein